MTTTTELVRAITESRLQGNADWHVRVGEWWHECERSPEEARAVFNAGAFDGEPCRNLDAETWVAIWRRVGSVRTDRVRTGRHARPGSRTRIFRAAEEGFVRALSWTPERGFAEMWRQLGVPALDEQAIERAHELMAGDGQVRRTVSGSGAEVQLWTATVEPEGVLAILDHPPGLEYVVDPSMLEEVERLEPDMDAATEFARRAENDHARFPRFVCDSGAPPERRVYMKQADGYHVIPPSKLCPDPMVLLDPAWHAAHRIDDDGNVYLTKTQAQAWLDSLVPGCR